MNVTYQLLYKDKIQDVTVNEIELCPMCHSGGHPHFDFGCLLPPKNENEKLCAFVILYCTVCKQQFIVRYDFKSGASMSYISYSFPNKHIPKTFNEHISAISPNFSEIFNQSLQAENVGLNKLAGIGYRKSLEFLVKDYLIVEQNEDATLIKNLELGKCVSKIKNDNIQTLARGATWLGNDETHYERRHTDYDITHLKLFIDYTVQYIIGEGVLKQAQTLTSR